MNFEFTNPEGALIFAAEDGRDRVVRRILKNRPDLLSWSVGLIALAVKYNRYKVLKVFMDLTNNDIAYEIACQSVESGNSRVFTWLITRYDMNDNAVKGIIQLARDTGRIDIIENIIPVY